MSKSLGNSPDLLDLIDKYGADAVRFGIMISSPAGNDLLFDDSSCEQGRNFNNKIWNALKLVKLWEGKKSDPDRYRDGSQKSEVNFAVEWFEHRLNEARTEVDKLYRDFRLSEALKTIYSLIWDDFCSWYLEWVKPGFEQPIDAAVYNKTVSFFEQLMQLLHPFMPFVSEEIYHLLNDQRVDLCVKQFPDNKQTDSSILQQTVLLKELITNIRDAKNKNQVKPKDKIKLHIQSQDGSVYRSIASILSKQVNAETISYVTEPVANCINVVVQKDKFFIETETVLDIASQKTQLLKDLEYQKGFLLSVEKKLSNERFVQNAKPDVIDIERKKKADAEAKIRAIEESLESLG